MPQEPGERPDVYEPVADAEIPFIEQLAPEGQIFLRLARLGIERGWYADDTAPAEPLVTVEQLLATY